MRTGALGLKLFHPCDRPLEILGCHTPIEL
jgi:hypothetical protein